VRRLLIALALVAGSAFAPELAAPASAGVVSGSCPTSKGVTVVVNFGSLGGGTQVHCYAGATSSTSGLSALHGAGFSTVGTQHDGDGFVCRIDDKPDAAQENCINTPPASAYWSYWQATNGGSWVYSSLGGASSHVHAGGFEGWSFGNGGTKPSSGSPARPPEPTLKLGGAASTTTHRASAASSSSTSKPPVRKGSPTTTATAASTSATESPSASTTSADSAGGALPGDPPDPGRSPWPFVGGAVGIAAILAGAYLVVLRRRGSIWF
jgi:hypothetical protein